MGRGEREKEIGAFPTGLTLLTRLRELIDGGTPIGVSALADLLIRAPFVRPDFAFGTKIIAAVDLGSGVSIPAH